MVGSILNTQVAYAIVLCRPREPWIATLIPILQVGKVSQRKSSRAEVTWLGNEELLSPACCFTAFPKPMLLTNSTSQHGAPSAGLSRYQWLKATHGPCPAVVPVSQRKNIGPTELMPAVLCCGNLNSQTSGVRSELFPSPCCLQGFWDSPWTQVWQIIDTMSH